MSDDDRSNERRPFLGLFLGLIVFAGFPFLWRAYLSQFGMTEWFGFVVSFLLGVLIYFFFAFRQGAHVIAERITKDVYASREWFRNLYDYAPTAYVLLATNGKIRQPNKAALRLYGKTAEELYERPFEELFVEEDRIDAKQYFEYFRTPQPVVDKEMRVKGKNGEIRWVLLSIFSLSGGKKDDQFGLVALTDITGRKEIEHAKSDFVSLAAHQLRTPLATMKWYLEGLLSKDAGALNEKQERYAEKVYEKNESLIELVDLLLNVSRIELGTFQIEPKEIKLHELIDGVVENIALYLEKKKLTVEKKYEEKASFTTDPKLVSVIVENLLTNAVKYTPEGGKITITVSKEGDIMQVSIADTGYGIAPDEQKKIFTKLFRAENAQHIDPGGSGLGLYLTYKIVTALNGTIDFKSELNKGTTFTVRFPSLS